MESVDPSNLPAVWKACLKLLTAQGPGLHSLFAQGRLVAIEDDRAVLRFSSLHETFVLNWEKNGKKEVVRDAISRVINQKIGVKFEIDTEPPSAESAPSNGTPVTAPPTTTRSEPQRVEAAAPSAPTIKVTPDLVASLRESEPLVKELMDKLGAQIIKVE